MDEHVVARGGTADREDATGRVGGSHGADRIRQSEIAGGDTDGPKECTIGIIVCGLYGVASHDIRLGVSERIRRRARWRVSTTQQTAVSAGAHSTCSLLKNVAWAGKKKACR